MGCEAIRETIPGRQKAMGIVPGTTELSPVNPYAGETGPDGQGGPEPDTVRPRGSLSGDEKRLFARMAEVYAGFLGHADHEIGRLTGYLEQTGQPGNTIVVLVSGNGASGEGGPVSEDKFFSGLPDSIEENLRLPGGLGGTRTCNHYATGRAWAFNPPFMMWKRYGNLRGGTAGPLIISWLAGIQARGGFRRQRGHRQAHAVLPDARHPRPAAPGMAGFQPEPGGAQRLGPLLRPALGTVQHRPRPQRMPWPSRTRTRPAAGTHRPAVGRSREIPGAAAGDPHRRGSLHHPRPGLPRPRTRYTCFPGGAEVPGSQAPDIRGRPHTIAAGVEIDSEDAGGALFSQGSRFGGHALYVKDGKLAYAAVRQAAAPKAGRRA